MVYSQLWEMIIPGERLYNILKEFRHVSSQNKYQYMCKS